MKHFRAKVKESTGNYIYPEYIGDVTKEYLIDFLGLNKPDVLEWDIEELDD